MHRTGERGGSHYHALMDNASLVHLTGQKKEIETTDEYR
jgi:hypothetical protein